RERPRDRPQRDHWSSREPRHRPTRLRSPRERAARKGNERTRLGSNPSLKGTLALLGVGPAAAVFFLGQESRMEMGNRLYVGNLSFSSTEHTLRDAFAAYGAVTDVHVVTDRMTGQSRGFGFVTMGSDSEAASAIEAMNGADLDGRALKVNEAEER